MAEGAAGDDAAIEDAIVEHLVDGQVLNDLVESNGI